MGLDTVELVMAIEDEFGENFSNEQWAKVHLVGEVYELLLARLSNASPPLPCISQHVFYQIRNAFVKNYGLPRRSIRPGTRLSQLMSQSELEQGWDYLQLHLNLKMPELSSYSRGVIFVHKFTHHTIKDVVKSVMSLNSSKLEPVREPERTIWNRLRQVVLQQLSVDPHEIVLGASITHDLGCD